MCSSDLSEAENEMTEQFGVQRIEDVVRAHATEPAADILEALVEAVRQWTGERGPNDDLTLLVLRSTGTAPAMPTDAEAAV